MFIGTLKAGQPFNISFAADGANAGSTGVGRHWFASDGTTVPDDIFKFVAPAMTDLIDVGLVPKNATTLLVSVHPPTGGGGTLDVAQGTTHFNKPPISGEANWLFAIVP